MGVTYFEIEVKVVGEELPRFLYISPSETVNDLYQHVEDVLGIEYDQIEYVEENHMEHKGGRVKLDGTLVTWNSQYLTRLENEREM